MLKLDLLAFAAHPDDVELAASGTMIKHQQLGYKTGIVDLTQGELGTRGSAELRKLEAEKASFILGLAVRENLEMADGFFVHNEQNLVSIIQRIRKYQPELVLANAISDRHTDHGKGSKLVSDACFLAGLRKIETLDDTGAFQAPWRPKAVYHYIQDRYIKPDFVVDITPYFYQKVEAIKAFSSQFYSEEATEPETPISRPDFLDFIEGRAREMGREAGFTFAEGFTVERMPGVKDLFDLI